MVLKEGKKCRYQEPINARPDVATISERILLEGRSVERNASGVAIRFHREDLVPKAQILLLLFILYNLRLRSHTSTFTFDTTQLLYLIMSGKRIDVAQIIANEMRNVAENAGPNGRVIRRSVSGILTATGPIQLWSEASHQIGTTRHSKRSTNGKNNRGLAALLVQGFSGRPVKEIIRVTPGFEVLLGLQQSLTPSRNNGFLNMLKLMQKKHFCSM
ncbi:hypothetical protein RYX36_026453 [Vicia faba]